MTRGDDPFEPAGHRGLWGSRNKQPNKTEQCPAYGISPAANATNKAREMVEPVCPHADPARVTDKARSFALLNAIDDVFLGFDRGDRPLFESALADLTEPISRTEGSSVRMLTRRPPYRLVGRILIGPSGDPRGRSVVPRIIAST
jgi:hypothetical protein